MTTSLILVGLAAVVVALICGVQNWRRSVYWLLLFLPFAGIPTIALYPAPAITRLLKDIYFLLPSYVGFMMWAPRRGGVLLTFPVSPLLRWLLAIFAGLAFVEAFNPSSPAMIATLVGLKTWLAYIPLLVLGFNLVESKADVERLFRFIALVGIIPVAIGLAQSILIAVGRSDIAYLPYGDAADAVTQGFSETNFGVGQSRKAPGIFTFITQYYNFLLVIVVISFAAGLANRVVGRRAIPFFALAATASLAAFLSGSRGAFFIVPLLLAIVTVLSGNAMVALQTTLLTAGAIAIAVASFGTTLLDLWQLLSGLILDYATVTPLGELQTALGFGYWGMGTGYNTGPARLANDQAQLAVENYFAKTIVELGVIGATLLFLIAATLLLKGGSSMRQTKDRQAKMYAAGLFALLLVSIANFWKGSYLDVDPLNVYFWLLTGVLFRLPTLTATVANTGPKRSVSPRRLAFGEDERRLAYARRA